MINNLSFWRKQRSLTQSQLADKVGCSRNTISAIEVGSWSPTIKLAANIAEKLRVPINRIFDFSDEFVTYNVVQFSECDICPNFECVHCKLENWND